MTRSGGCLFFGVPERGDWDHSCWAACLRALRPRQIHPQFVAWRKYSSESMVLVVEDENSIHRFQATVLTHLLYNARRHVSGARMSGRGLEKRFRRLPIY